MTSTTFDYHDDYYAINTGAHRKGGLELDAPTLTHHLGLWHPRQAGPFGIQRSVNRHGKLADTFIAAHYAALRGLDGFQCNFEFNAAGTDVICLFGGAYHAADPRALAPFQVLATPAHFALKDAIESDNRILFMKARWTGVSVIVRCEFHSEYFTITRVVTITDLAAVPAGIGDLGAALRSLTNTGLGADPAMTTEACHACLYRDVWDALDRDLFACAGLFRTAADTGHGRVFADFRGLVLTGDDSPQAGGLSLAGIRTVPKARQPYRDDWPVQTLLPSLWPFLTVEKGLDLKRREFTASFMLRRHAVYITALGPQPPADGAFVCAPLHYLLVARPISDWQLGTLVDRLHFMGTVRLAALMELAALKVAGANLRAMENEAEEARNALDRDRLDLALHHYERAQDLTAHTDGNKRPIFWEGIQFRVERSRYYVNRFHDFVPFLEMSQIEGFQQYDHFVRARLGGNYDYINRLGARQERAVRSVDGIRQSIALKDSTQISRTIEKLQTKAEIALLAVIVPHYAMEIYRAFREQADRNDQTVFRWFMAFLVVGGMLALTSLGAYLYDLSKQRDYRRLFHIFVKYGLLLAASMAVTNAIMSRRFW